MKNRTIPACLNGETATTPYPLRSGLRSRSQDVTTSQEKTATSFMRMIFRQYTQVTMADLGKSMSERRKQ